MSIAAGNEGCQEAACSNFENTDPMSMSINEQTLACLVEMSHAGINW